MKLEIQIDSGLSIRRVRHEDADRYFQLSDANRERLREWLPWLDDTRSVADTLLYLETCIADFERGVALHYFIIVNGEIAGIVGANRIDAQNKSAIIGYWLDEVSAGNGYMTKACKELVRQLFARYDMNRIVINVAVGNRKSAAIPARLGFTREGVVREAEWLYDHFVDLNVYSLLRCEWDGA